MIASTVLNAGCGETLSAPRGCAAPVALPARWQARAAGAPAHVPARAAPRGPVTEPPSRRSVAAGARHSSPPARGLRAACSSPAGAPARRLGSAPARRRGPGATHARPRAVTVSRTRACGATCAWPLTVPRRVTEKTRRAPERERTTTRAVAWVGRVTRAASTTATMRVPDAFAEAKRHTECCKPRRPSPPSLGARRPPLKASARPPTRRMPITLNTAATGTRRARSRAERTNERLPARPAEQAGATRALPAPSADRHPDGRSARQPRRISPVRSCPSSNRCPSSPRRSSERAPPRCRSTGSARRSKPPWGSRGYP